MKKILLILLCITLALSFGACSSDNKVKVVEETKKMSDILNELFDKYSGGKPDIFEADDTSIICEVTDGQFTYDYDVNPWTLISDLNSMLGFGAALDSKIENTRPLDGTLTDENDKYKVTWSYASDELNIIYEMK